MARVTYVKKAQQRFKTVPVLDENGNPKRTPVMRSVRERQEDGSYETRQVPKTTKKGKPVTRAVVEPDRSKPLPNHTCDKCGKEVEVGHPYKWIKPKSGPYGGRMRVRCGSCPAWHVWEYSSSTSARVAEIAFNATEGAGDDQASVDDFTALANSAAEEVRALADEKHESASNIEDGFGTPTSTSEELEALAVGLEDWADEIESIDFPEEPDSCDVGCDGGSVACDTCGGTGRDEDSEDDECPDCDSGEVSCEECSGTGDATDAQMAQWRSECLEALEEVLGNSPV